MSSVKIFSILAIFLSLSSCRNSSQEAKDKSQQTYTIVTLKGPSSMGMIKMIDSLNRKEEANVRVMILNEPIQARKMMFEGTADFAILPTTMASIIYNKGLDYRIIGVPDWGSLFLFGSDSSVTNWQQLKGKRVYLMAKGMTPDVLFRYLLKKNGIAPEKDIALDYSFPTHIDLANAVAAGQAPLGVISEPLASLAMQRNKSVKTVIDLNEEWRKCQGIPMALTAFLAKGSIIQNNRNIVEKLISGYRLSTKWVNQYPDSAAQLIVKYGILPDYKVALNSIPRSSLDFISTRDAKSQIKEFLRVFYLLNPEIIGGKMPDENFYY